MRGRFRTRAYYYSRMVSPRHWRGWKWSRVRWTLRAFGRQLKKWVQAKVNFWRICMLSLCYNEFVDKYYLADTAMEPMFWFVDHFTKFFGPMFVCLVCCLIFTGVILIYIIGIPYWWNKSPTALYILLVIGHWILVNVVFHYWMAAVTSPGHLPEGVLIQEAVSICKKCISPKPPRTHHCSICNKCILKMDHHCPWLNNCIGHYNHRYFFMFMVYMIVGILFIIIFGFEILWEHLYDEETPAGELYTPDSNATLEFRKVEENSSVAAVTGLSWLVAWNMNKRPLIEQMKDQYWYHVSIVYLALLCSGVLIALGALTMWHARLITRGETSIEAHINKSELKRHQQAGRVYKNPYNWGTTENWNMFLGLQDGRNWLHVLFPSRHKPAGDGLRWRTAY